VTLPQRDAHHSEVDARHEVDLLTADAVIADAAPNDL
jgi:hypothetical protein